MPQFEPGDFRVLYPGVLNDREKALAEKYIAGKKAIARRGEIGVQALVRGKLPADTPGLGPSLYVRDGEFFVDLAWWIESIAGDIWLQGAATVKLPSNRAQ